MASTIVRALIEGATWESIQAQPYNGTCYPCGCHPHPKEPHLRFHLCDYHDGFDSGVDQGCHELQTEIERLRQTVRDRDGWNEHLVAEVSHLLLAKEQLAAARAEIERLRAFVGLSLVEALAQLSEEARREQ